MTDFLDALGQQLVKAANEHTHLTPSQAPRHRQGRRSLRVIAAVALLLLLTAAVALAAVALSTGSPVARPPGQSATAGVGLPARGGSRLLPIRVSDPAGGLPWGMRIIHTTRGLICVQVGRVYHGQLGLLGRDGAFGDDGRFHPLPPQDIAAPPNLAVTAGPENCASPGGTFSNFISGLPESGELILPRSGDAQFTARATELRWISFGVLGDNARSITYRRDGQTIIEAVQPYLGAYLIVQRGFKPGTHEPRGGTSSGASNSALGAFRPQPAGAVTTITYRLGGRLCQDSSTPTANPCPAPAAGGPPETVSQRLHRVIHVSLTKPPGPSSSAIVTFTAPYTVTNAITGYQIAMPTACHHGTVIDTIDHNVRAGERVRTRVIDPFANACGKTLSIQVLYGPSGYSTASKTPTILVGETTLKRPRRTGPH
jgi:hypothetical protein